MGEINQSSMFPKRWNIFEIDLIIQSKPSTGHLNFLCNDSCPRAYLPYFSNEQFLSAVRQPIKSLVVVGTGRGDGQTVMCSRACSTSVFGSIRLGDDARASNVRGERLGS